MSLSVDQLYDELVTHYPEMKNNPEQWKQHISLFLKNRPKDQPDDVFKTNLKNTMLAKLEQQEAAPKPFPFSVLLFGGLGGVLVAGLVFAVWLQAIPQSEFYSTPESQITGTVPPLDAPALDAETTLISVAEDSQEESFGTITYTAGNTASPETSSLRNQSGGGGTSSSDAKIGIVPPSYGERINIEYTIQGALPELPNEVKVYKKQTFTQQVNPQALVGEQPLPVRFDNFSNITAQNFSLKANIGETPFFITVNADMGSMSVSQDYQYIMRLLCSTPDCYLGPITKEKLMSDDAMIQKASAFLAMLGVDTSMTSGPYVEKNWLDESGESTYIPEIITVVFPFNVDGKEVVTGWKSKEGIRVSINQHSKEVSDAFIPSLSLLSSNYAVSDTAALTEQAQKGGMYGITYNNPDRTVQVRLTNPRLELRSIEQYKEGVSETYYLPMLVFDTQKENEREQYYVPEEITVPLAKNVKIQ